MKFTVPKAVKYVYLVDYENVGNRIKIAQKSESKIFYFSNKREMDCIKSNEVCLNLKVSGKNALDFILDSRLGFLIATYGKKKSYIIVSNDKGYDTVINYWKSLGYSVSRRESQHKTVSRNVNQPFCFDITHQLKQIGLTDKQVRKINNVYISFTKAKHPKLKNINRGLEPTICCLSTSQQEKIRKIFIKELLE